MLRVTFIGVALTIAITALICAFIFNTAFAKDIIDYFSFFAAGFLIIEGLYKIRHYKSEPYFPAQLIRHVRIIIGASVLTIHVMQFVYVV